MLTSLWIATQESSCAYQVMFHPDGAKSPHEVFATVTFFKPVHNQAPHIQRDERFMSMTDAELVRAAQGVCQGS